MPSSEVSKILEPEGGFVSWYEELERALVREYVQPRHVVLEAGGGAGAVSREIAERARFLVTCEPQEEPYRCLLKNAPEALAINAALTEDGEPLEIGLYEKFWAAGYWGNSVLGDAKETVTVPGVSMMGLLRSPLGINALVLDTEGYEVKLLKDAPLENIELIILEMHPDFCEPEELAAMQQRLEEERYVVFEAIRDRDTVHCAYLKD